MTIYSAAYWWKSHFSCSPQGGRGAPSQILLMAPKRMLLKDELILHLKSPQVLIFLAIVQFISRLSGYPRTLGGIAALPPYRREQYPPSRSELASRGPVHTAGGDAGDPEIQSQQWIPGRTDSRNPGAPALNTRRPLTPWWDLLWNSQGAQAEILCTCFSGETIEKQEKWATALTDLFSNFLFLWVIKDNSKEPNYEV